MLMMMKMMMKKYCPRSWRVALGPDSTWIRMVVGPWAQFHKNMKPLIMRRPVLMFWIVFGLFLTFDPGIWIFESKRSSWTKQNYREALFLTQHGTFSSGLFSAPNPHEPWCNPDVTWWSPDVTYCNPDLNWRNPDVTWCNPDVQPDVIWCNPDVTWCNLDVTCRSPDVPHS